MYCPAIMDREVREVPPQTRSDLQDMPLTFWHGYSQRAADIFSSVCPYASDMENIEWWEGIDQAELDKAGARVSKKQKESAAYAIGGFTPPHKFGREHWSTLVYAETRNVDYGRFLDKRHLRINENRHPAHAVNPTSWKDDYSTRLNDGTVLDGHDDWDILNDLERVGLLDIVSESNACVPLTELGYAVAAEIRKHRGQGGSYEEFKLSVPLAAMLAYRFSEQPVAG